jgi:hypothetical protein
MGWPDGLGRCRRLGWIVSLAASSRRGATRSLPFLASGKQPRVLPKKIVVYLWGGVD